MDENIEILRRIAERGLKVAQEEKENHSNFIDVFQHLLDEIKRLKLINKESK